MPMGAGSAADLAVIRAWPAAAVVTLLDQDEMQILRVPDLGSRILDCGLEWFHLGIADGAAPDFRFEQRWLDVVGDLLDLLIDGKNVLLHCRGGKGRTGTVGALMLIELGVPASMAIEMIRAARPGAIETSAQEQYIHDYAPRTR